MSSVFVCEDNPAPSNPAGCTTWTAEPHTPSPFSMSVEAATEIGTAILLVWVTAWAFRTLARFLRDFG